MCFTDYAVAVCEAARASFAAEGVQPRRGLLSVPNGIRLERFKPADAAGRQVLATELGWPLGSRIIGTVGRLQPVKDHALLLRAFIASVFETLEDAGERERIEAVAQAALERML